MSEPGIRLEDHLADISDEAIGKSVNVCRMNAKAALNAHVAATQLGIAGTLRSLQAALAERTKERDEARAALSASQAEVAALMAALAKAKEATHG